jgi:aldehyde:ferredoxin oxidoreductase
MLMYASESRDPTIGTHSACFLLADLYIKYGDLALRKFRQLSEDLWGSDQGLEPNYEHVVPVTMWAQHQHIAIDSLPLCDFVFPRTIGGFKSEEEWLESEGTDHDIELGARLISACTGVDYTDEELESVGERVFNIERSMLAEFGRDRALDASIEPHFELPCKTDGTCLDEPLFNDLLDQYYKYRGWDLERGWPTRRTLESLGLEDAADRLAV